MNLQYLHRLKWQNRLFLFINIVNFSKIIFSITAGSAKTLKSSTPTRCTDPALRKISYIFVSIINICTKPTWKLLQHEILTLPVLYRKLQNVLCFLSHSKETHSQSESLDISFQTELSDLPKPWNSDLFFWQLYLCCPVSSWCVRWCLIPFITMIL